MLLGVHQNPFFTKYTVSGSQQGKDTLTLHNLHTSIHPENCLAILQLKIYCKVNLEKDFFKFPLMPRNKETRSIKTIPCTKWVVCSLQYKSCRWGVFWRGENEVHSLLTFISFIKFNFLKSFHYLPEKVRLSIKFKIFPFKIHVELWSSGIRYFDYYCKKIRILGQLKSWSYHDESYRKSNHQLCGPIKIGKQEKIIVISNLWQQVVSLQNSTGWPFQILTELSSTYSWQQ